MSPPRDIPHSLPASPSQGDLTSSPPSVGELPLFQQKTIPHSLQPPPSLWMRTEIYSSHGGHYCRFRWGKGRENWGYVHINGGNASTELVQGRRRLVDEAIARNDDLLEILQLLQQFPAERAGRKRF